MPHPGLSHNTQAPHPQPPDPHELGSQRQRFADVASASDTAIEHDVRLITDGSHDVLQRVKGRDGAVDLSPGVVADHDAVHTDLNGFLRVRDALDAFKAEGLATADLLPRLDQPRNLAPVMGAAVPHVVDPHSAGALRVFLRVDTCGRKALLEDRVRKAEIGTDPAIKGVVALRDIVVTPAQLPGVGGEDADVEAGLEGASEQADGQLIVVRHVELVESRTGAVGSSDVLDGGGAGGG